RICSINVVSDTKSAVSFYFHFLVKENAATAEKVALMKFKFHVSGDKGLPQTERTYFQMFLPKEAKDPSFPMFFCSKWSVGKIVDFVASQASLKNNNNVLTAKMDTSHYSHIQTVPCTT
uniref:Zinc finger, AN1-type domain 1 n=1 Tax=Cyprinus carpio TaxID=7962 RepID=A0A8C1LHX7_CYPCA